MNAQIPTRNLADALWLLVARARGGAHWLANTACDVHSVEIEHSAQPVTLLRSERSSPQAAQQVQSYVASPVSSWVSYPQHELARRLQANPGFAARTAAACALSPLSLLLKGCGLDQAAIFGNRLISTNLYPDWTYPQLQQLQQQLLDLYPQRPLMLRNICPQVTPGLAKSLQDLGWQLIPARLVYLCEPGQASVWKHNHVKQDKKLLAGGDMQVLSPQQLQAADLPAMRELFRSLFIHKHSGLNPDFTPAFFEMCLESNFLDLYALRLQEKIVGVVGLYEHYDPYSERNWLTTPLIGYDQNQAQDLGIYRRLMSLLLQQAQQRQASLHYSSGAGQFKRARGGIAHLEYTAVYSSHLPRFQRHCNEVFAALMQKHAPAILKKADSV
ncbi:hypothetical protein [Undibacterium terreum]|uniref:BioF2-like acetyltransferase domain-containing protein n=1 Tax=Undibacterium terreum TaxID=1224302 RepID=A0A916XR86_9BURK|nr:hypothetical protein [Undibacterium terreum]GGC95124.1 hypothetical protein GCM10011396_48080 [Undibacterium terreum]